MYIPIETIKKALAPDHIVGILIWAAMNQQLTNEVLELAQTLPKDYYTGLDDQWWLVAKYIHSEAPLPLSDELLAHVQDMLLMEMPTIVRMMTHEPEVVYD